MRKRQRLATGYLSIRSPKSRIIHAVFVQGRKKLKVWETRSEEKVKAYLDRNFTKEQLWVALDSVDTGGAHEAFTNWKPNA